MIPYYCPNELKRGTDGSAGYDLICTNGTDKDMNHVYDADGGYRLEPGTRVLMHTDLFMAIPRGYFGAVCSRSGLALHQGVVVLNAPGIIDSDYRGEVCVLLANLGNARHVVRPGDKVAQILIQKSRVDRPGLNPEFQYGNDGEVFWRFHHKELWEARAGQTERGTGGHGSTGR